MDTTPSNRHPGKTAGGGSGEVTTPAMLGPADKALRSRILAHCRELYAIDRTYANWAFDNYARMVPWLGLERKQ